MTLQRISKSNLLNKETKNPKNNFILKVMEEEFGFTAAHSILSYVSRSTMKPLVAILSDYDTFSSIFKQVYPNGVAEKEILDRLSSYELGQKI